MSIQIPPKDTFESLLDKQIYYFIDLKRLYGLQTSVLQKCEGRPIKNDLIYHQMLFAGFDGLFARLYNFHDSLQDFLNDLKSNHMDRFARNKKRELKVNPAEIYTDNFDKRGVDRKTGDFFTRELQVQFDKTYDRLFPGVKERGAGRPSHSDFDMLANELRNIFVPIKAHRDTVVAHWDEKQEPATVQDLKKTMEYIEYLLGALQTISRLAVPNFELGGIAARVGSTATDIAELILGKFRLRIAKPEEMNEIFLMGFDIWANGQTERDYLDSCHESPKYAKGTWYVLEDRKGKAVSSVIVYPLQALGDDPAIGLGSLATHPSLRKKGHAGQLVHDVLTFFHDSKKIQIAYLWSDISTEFYRRLRFTKLPEKFQTKAKSSLMIRCSKEQMDNLLFDSAFKPPSYF